MTRSQFLGLYEKLWELPAGTLKPENRIDELNDFDSFAVISTIVWMDREFSLGITVEQLIECRTLGEILNLAGERLAD